VELLWRVTSIVVGSVADGPGSDGHLGSDMDHERGVSSLAEFDELQVQLDIGLAANRVGSGVDHVVIALPSFSLGESLLSHYVERIPALEHRYLPAMLLLDRIDSCEFVFVSCQAPEPEVIDYYLSLLPEARRDDARRRLRVLEVPDGTGRPVAAKLLDRPDLIDPLRGWIAGRPAVIEPWNVQDDEVELAGRLGVPINGTSPSLWPLGFKSAGRRLFAEAGVPIPIGRQNIRSVAEINQAVNAIRADRPALPGIVIKLDDSGAGDGNVVVDLREPDALRRALDALPQWYVDDLRAGGVVEELITASTITSPSVQFDMMPDESVRVLATHEQVLGGTSGQVYVGCCFPADAEYAAILADYAHRVGTLLAQQGARGRAGLDFMASRRPNGSWDLRALEINLRKGGTTHPYAVLRNIAPGHYDVDRGAWITDRDGSTRAYRSTDNLVDPSWIGLPPSIVIDEMKRAGLQYDSDRGSGVVLHMLAGLAIDGRLGLTAIGRNADEAGHIYDAATEIVADCAR